MNAQKVSIVLLNELKILQDSDADDVFSLAGCDWFVWDRSPCRGREGRRVCMARWPPFSCFEGRSLGCPGRGKDIFTVSYTSFYGLDITNSNPMMLICSADLLNWLVLFFMLTVKPGLSVGFGGSERLLWSQSRDLHSWTGHEFPGSAGKDQDLWLPKPLHSRRWPQGTAQILPQQIHSGKERWRWLCKRFKFFSALLTHLFMYLLISVEFWGNSWLTFFTMFWHFTDKTGDGEDNQINL